MSRVLLLVSTTSYRTDAFLEAAERLGAEGVVGSDRCHVLDELLAFPARSLALDFRHPARAAGQIVAAAAERPFDAIVPTSDATAVIAALAARELRLPHNSPEAAATARNKLALRDALARAGVRAPRHLSFPLGADPGAVEAEVARAIGYPCVLKPLLLSASRGVIRADDAAQFLAAFHRLHALLSTAEMKALAEEDPAGARLLVERFVPGAEVALEGILSRGQLRPLALFDKPDPLDGPFFEETIYVTPSRLPAALQQAIVDETARAAAAIGLVEGPVHAELRLAPAGATVLPTTIEVAARTIGGLCARTLRFTLDDGAGSGRTLEELVVAHALGRPLPEESHGRLGDRAAGVMMLPIPAPGVLHAVDGVDEARAVPLVSDVVITTRLGEKLIPLPEGSSYLGFVFARGESPAAVEAGLREAHRRLRFTVTPLL